MQERSPHGCNGKFSYSTMAEARAAGRESQKRRGGPKMAAYFCEECQGFHIGRPSSKASAFAKGRRQANLDMHGGRVRVETL